MSKRFGCNKTGPVKVMAGKLAQLLMDLWTSTEAGKPMQEVRGKWGEGLMGLGRAG